MKKGILALVSILAVVILVAASFTNVVGVQTVESSSHILVNEKKANQKELLFELILNIANNGEIQNIIKTSEIKGVLEKPQLKSGAKLFLFNQGKHFGVSSPSPPVLTKKYLEYAYRMGIILSRAFDSSKMHSILERLQINSQETQKEITAVIEKNNGLHKEIGQLSNIQCNCENDTSTGWNFPVICTLLFFLFWFSFILWITHINTNLVFLIGDIGKALNCFWPSP
jgi:hypothetical protein